MEPRSILVYGTLRTGGYFSRILPPYNDIKLVEFHGIRMYSYNLGAYPCAIITDDEEDYVIAELRDYSNLTDAEWKALITELDRVENVAAGLFQRNVVKSSLGMSIVYTANRKWFDDELAYYNKARKPLEIVHDWACKDARVAMGVKNVKVGKA